MKLKELLKVTERKKVEIYDFDEKKHIYLDATNCDLTTIQLNKKVTFLGAAGNMLYIRIEK